MKTQLTRLQSCAVVLCAANLLISSYIYADTEVNFSDNGTATSTVTTGSGGQVAGNGNISTAIDSNNTDVEVDNDVFNDISATATTGDLNIGSNNSSLNTVATQELEIVVSGNTSSTINTANGGSPDCGANGLVLGASCTKSNNEGNSGNGGSTTVTTGSVNFGTFSHQYQTGASPTILNTGINSAANGGSNMAANSTVTY